MKVHEYQAKELFKEYGIPVTPFEIAGNAEEAAKAAEQFGDQVVIKAQVLTGGRGRAGGVKLARGKEEAEKRARDILGLQIKDIPVEKIMISPAAEIEQEYYLGIVLDRKTKSLVLMMSGAGGVDIEELAATEPAKIQRMNIRPDKGIDKAQLDELLAQIFADGDLAEQARDCTEKLYKLFLDKDCSLVEINPYALIENKKLVALDAKINFDDNALFLHPEIEELKNSEEYSDDEIEAKQNGLSFVSMEGDIGCIVNGAGLAMATMDIIKLYGGNPANFLDVGGSSNPEKVINALKIILRNKNVKSILINIFGGITRCDDIAEGLLMARKSIDIPVPMVIRLIGTNEIEGRKMLEDEGIPTAENLSEAVQKVVSIA